MTGATIPVFEVPTDPRSPVLYVGDEQAKRILFIHGFTGSPQSFSPQYRSAIAAGFNVSVPLLRGHGSQIEDMLDTRYSDYLNDVLVAHREFCPNGEQIYVVGLSMGGTLALDLALRVDNIAAMVLVNPLVLPPAPYFMEILDQILASGTEITPGIGSDIAEPGASEASYPGSPVRAAKSLFEATSVIYKRVGEINIPIRLFSSSQDHVVSVESGEYLAENAPNVERILLARSFHVATLDYDKDVISDGILEFVGKY